MSSSSTHWNVSYLCTDRHAQNMCARIGGSIILLAKGCIPPKCASLRFLSFNKQLLLETLKSYIPFVVSGFLLPISKYVIFISSLHRSLYKCEFSSPVKLALAHPILPRLTPYFTDNSHGFQYGSAA